MTSSGFGWSFFALAALFFVACNTGSFRDKIEGNWKVVQFKIQNPDELKPELVDETTAIAETVRYRFNRDFTYDIRSRADSKSSTGTWKYDPESKELILQMADQDKTNSKVQWLDSDKLVLQTKMGTIGDVELTLERVE
ncbi:lipocalin family protein [Halocola ammonii]